MNHPQNIERFRANPVEIVILLTILGIFMSSVYSLLYDRRGFHPAALSPMTSNPISEGRAPSSVSQSLLTVQVPCDRYLDRDTLANKIRLSGALCGTEPTLNGNQPLKATIVNNVNHYEATVFTDSNNNKYSTDYIPLSQGKNVIHIEFSYVNGKSIAQDIQVMKN